jgi:G3E family GTPase
LAASLVASIKDFRRHVRPDFLFLEPSELVLIHEIRNVTAMGLRDVVYDIGPFISLVDGPNFRYLWEERRLLLVGQIQGADVVAISRSDLMDAGEIEDITHILKDYSPGVLQLSTRTGLGLEEVVKAISGL